MIRFKLAALAGAVAVLGACSGDKSKGDIKAEGDAPWSPAKLTSVKGVPAADVEAAIRRRLDGQPPAKIDADQWAHTKKLYKIYGGNALWLAADGLHNDRTLALANAVLQGEQDGM